MCSRLSRPLRRAAAAALVALAGAGTAGCSSIGPATVARDRADYAGAIGEAARREILSNIVSLRYLETPTIVAPTQVVTSYELQGSLSLGTDLSRSGLDLADDVDLGAAGSFADRPTLTYTPVRGDAFARMMLAPIPLADLMALLAAGAPADIVLGLSVRSINGLRNVETDWRGTVARGAAFGEAIGLIEQLLDSGQLGFRFSGTAVDLVVRAAADRPLDAPTARLLALLGLDPARRSFALVFGFPELRQDRVSLHVRSLIDILGGVAARIDVPEPDVASGRTYPSRAAEAGDGAPALRVLAGPRRPADAFVAVQRRGTWFWIPDTSLDSKGVFAILSLLHSLADPIDRQPGPLLTIPTG